MEKSMTKSCKKCGKEFLIAKQEELFYEKKALPLPFECPECRRNRRRDMRNVRKLYPRKCDKCEVSLQSSYAEGGSFPVYCEKCYFEEVA